MPVNAPKRLAMNKTFFFYSDFVLKFIWPNSKFFITSQSGGETEDSHSHFNVN